MTALTPIDAKSLTRRLKSRELTLIDIREHPLPVRLPVQERDRDLGGAHHPQVRIRVTRAEQNRARVAVVVHPDRLVPGLVIGPLQSEPDLPAVVNRSDANRGHRRGQPLGQRCVLRPEYDIGVLGVGPGRVRRVEGHLRHPSGQDSPTTVRTGAARGQRRGAGPDGRSLQHRPP